MKIVNRTPETRRSETPTIVKRFDRERLESHLSVSRYGAFQLTDAIRPAFDLAIVPEEGFRRDFYVDPDEKLSVPVLVAAVSREKLIDVFFRLIDALGDTLDVVVESSHDKTGDRAQFSREGIDAPVLKSILCDYEDVALNDGCFGIAAMNSETPCEIQFDEHKLLTVYGRDLRLFEKIFREFGVVEKPTIQFLTEAEHLHSSRRSFYRQFSQIKIDLAAD